MIRNKSKRLKESTNYEENLKLYETKKGRVFVTLPV